MLYVYIINVLYIRVPVRFSVRFRFGLVIPDIEYRKLGTVRIFEGFSPVSGILVWFRFFCPCLPVTIIPMLIMH